MVTKKKKPLQTMILKIYTEAVRQNFPFDDSLKHFNILSSDSVTFFLIRL